jgi:hypothetical protein
MWDKSLDLVPQYGTYIIKTRKLKTKSDATSALQIRILDQWIQCFFTPASEIPVPRWENIRIRDPRSGINISDHISESLVTIFWVKNTQNSLSIQCCGPGMEKSVYPGSTTLATARVLPGDAVFSEDLILLPLCRPVQPLQVSLHRPLQHSLRHTCTTSGLFK